MNRIVEILMNRDGMTQKDAERMLMEAQYEIYEGANPEHILEDNFGLEPDYLFDLI